MAEELNLGDTVEAEVTRIADFGAFVKINERARGLIHISRVSKDFVKDINKYLKVGDKVRAKVIKIGPGNKIDLSLKGDSAPRLKKNNFDPAGRRTEFRSSDFEEKLKKFLRHSQRNPTALKKHTEK